MSKVNTFLRGMRMGADPTMAFRRRSGLTIVVGTARRDQRQDWYVVGRYLKGAIERTNRERADDDSSDDEGDRAGRRVAVTAS